MIESITISSVGTFGAAPEQANGLSRFNFFFGSNGTGKTTISRVIAEETGFQKCSIRWKAGTKLKPLVYNRDFVDRNFNQSSELKGVFTLGEKQVDTLAKIDMAKREIVSLTDKIETLSHLLHGEDGRGGKKGDSLALEARFKEKCWGQKQKLDEKLQGGFEGYRNKAENFKDKVLQEQMSNKADLLELAELEKKAKLVFGPAPTKETTIPLIDINQLLAHEADPVLKKMVVGKGDVDIAAMIKKLANSDWVREGREFYDMNTGDCPFCQQSTSRAFAESLEKYFDETFVTDSKAIDNLTTNYRTESARVQQQLDSLIASPSKYLDVEQLKVEKKLLDAKITLNNQRLAGKRREASQVVELESLSETLETANSLIDAANAQVAAHNRMVTNLASERSALKAQVWRFVLDELKSDLDAYKSEKAGLNKAIAAMTDQIASATTEKAKKNADILELERQTTSIEPTIHGINTLLSSFGFQGFKVAKATKGHAYKLIRSDGSDAQATLSEGEKSFVTFLYFYHLLKGSESETGITADRIVVFDDPVSSLDNDILFIVGSLIKGLFDEVRAEAGHIKQIFVLTHNVYFHKEVAYNSKRKDVAMNEETFWIVRKSGPISKIDKHPTNPIRTSYELLWAEVRNYDRSSITIQNTLRRILENYFKILGGIEFDRLCAMFDGKEKLICKSLCSWVHDGSHYAHDDLYVLISDSMVESYMKVFRGVFEKSGHSEHYKMMMADAYVDDVPA